MRLIINTWPTKNTSWIVKDIDSDTLPSNTVLEKLAEVLKTLPTDVRLPSMFSKLSLPRYYMIVYSEDEDGTVKIVDVVGVRHNLAPTKWGYRLGYWHPQCQLLIYKALLKYLKQEVTQGESGTTN